MEDLVARSKVKYIGKRETSRSTFDLLRKLSPELTAERYDRRIKLLGLKNS